MNKTIKIEIPHKLTETEARQRIESGLQSVYDQVAGQSVHMAQSWTGNHLDFTVGAFNQSLTGRADVYEKVVMVEMDLPWLLTSLANKIQAKLQKQAAMLLEKKPQ